MSENSQQLIALQKRLERLDEALVLQRMRALGFWPKHLEPPPDPPEQARERAGIDAELLALTQSGLSGSKLDEALRAEQKRRWDASIKRRAERKLELAAQRAQRVSAWQAHKASHLLHAGVGVSTGLNARQSDLEKLARYGLPALHTPEQLAAAMGISISRLRWLSFHRRGASLVHYHRFSVPKKTGGVRHISAPKPALAAAQQWIHDQILRLLPTTEAAHGFVQGRSTLSNAQPHIAQALLCNLDLRDFFPSIRFARVRGIFHSLGYSSAVASVLALLCTEAPRLSGSISGDPQQRVFHLAMGERVLPQGACTSPALSNLICRRLDHRLSGLAQAFGYRYSRYADDLSFSCGAEGKADFGRFIASVRHILQAEGLQEHPEKTHVHGQGARMEVTGIVVNQQAGLKREDKRRLRAMLHQAAVHGLDAANREQHPNFANYLRGWVAYLCMVEPEQAVRWKQALRKALGR